MLLESDQILVPTHTGRRAFPLLLLMGFDVNQLKSWEGFGHAPFHFVEQRGPFQDGASVLDMRFDPRIIQIVIGQQVASRIGYWDRKNKILDLLRPSRSFASDEIEYLVYRKMLPGGKTRRGHDGALGSSTTVFTSDTAGFVHFGGLATGDSITVAGVVYTIADVLNDFTITTTGAIAGAAPFTWSYNRNRSVRDLYCLLERGPTFDVNEAGTPYRKQGFIEALRFVAHDPFWHGGEQTQTWIIPDDIGDLVFDGSGAWLGATAGIGRWLYSPTAVSETVDVIYFGTYRARPKITVSGPASGITVENTTTGKKIFVNYTLAAGESLTINTQETTVQKNDGTNLMPYATGDIATFGIVPEPKAANGANVILVAFSGGVPGASSAILYWSNLYVGI